MSKKDVDDCIFGCVVVVFETEFAKVAVVSNQLRNWICQFGDDVSKRRFIEWLVQVLHDSEIDVAFFKQGDRPARVASTRVEVQSHVLVGHRCKLDGDSPLAGRRAVWARLDRWLVKAILILLL